MDSRNSENLSGLDASSEHHLDRREFFRLSAISALMSSAMLTASPSALGAVEEAQKPRNYGALVPLAPGAVAPEGWLRGYMEKQAAQLGSQLPQVSWPFTDAYWAGEEKAESWWPWEQKAYWIDGATRLSIVLGDEKLQRQAQAAIDYTLAHAAPDGYLGPSYFEDDTGNYSRWPQTVFFRAMAASAEDRPTSEHEIAGAIRKHYLNDKTPYGKPVRNVTNIEAMLWCYERTGDARLLKMAESAWTEYLTVADPEHGDLFPLRVYADTAINSHGVTYAEISKLPAILYLHTGKAKYWKFAQAAQRRIFDHHMLIDGVPSTSEWFSTRTSLDSHETCDMSDHTWTWGYMLMASGDGVWGDRIERACFNAVPGAIRNDWKSLQYFSCPNQFLATFDSNHNIVDFGSYLMAYQPNPGRRTACCGGNVHRVLPNYVLRMWMQSADGGGLAATLYGPSRVKATVGANREPIEIVQTTNYPFEEQIQLEIRAKRAVHFPLSLRIPAWCAKPRLRLNGRSVDGLAVRNGFVTLDCRFSPGDTVTLEFPMQLAVSDWPENGIGIERGPLVYSLAIRENWQSSVVPRYATAEFPAWQATAVSAWNYGIDLRRENLEHQIAVQQKKVGDDPWSDPPITLTVPARKIEGWELLANPANPKQKFTPALPEVSRSRVSETTETISLVPYGSTKLRVTIFPSLAGVDVERERKI